MKNKQYPFFVMRWRYTLGEFYFGSFEKSTILGKLTIVPKDTSTKIELISLN